MNRRTFLKSAAVSAAGLSASCQASTSIDIIDTHTHFYDPFRPEGVPWPSKGGILYRKVFPADFMKLASPHGVTGTIVVEASKWLKDNQWILDLAQDNKSIVGFVGNVDPAIDDWDKHIKRFAANNLFRGIRLKESINKVSDTAMLKKFFQMADMDLTVDVNSGIKGFEAAVVLARKIPDLKIVIEHVPYSLKEEDVARYNAALKEVHKYPNIYAKVSTVLVKVKGQTITDYSFYNSRLDQLWDVFGEDRVIYGSNWPVSDLFNGTYAQIFDIVDEYYSAKGLDARAKYFSGNAARAYKWIKRA